MKHLIMVSIIVLLLTGCAEPLPEKHKDFAGLWKSHQTSLLITEGGRIEYESNKGSVSTSVSMPVKSITEREIKAGFLFFSATFTLEGRPREENGMLVLMVDGEKLIKTDELGRIPKATIVPSLSVLRPLITKELTLLAKGINEQDFSAYIENASLTFQSQFDDQRLQEAYQPFIEQQIDITQWMKGDFILTEEPEIDSNGVLIVNGKYPTSPDSLKFTLSYIYAHPHWKGVGANININEE